MNRDLLTVTPYGMSGSSARVRVFEWLAHLGLDAQRSTYLGLGTAGPRDVARSPLSTLRAELELRRLVRDVEDRTVLVCRTASPLSGGGLESRLLDRAARGVYDVDDALFEQHGSRLTAPFARSKVWHRSVRAADVVITGNELLADAAAREGAAEVVLVPSCVEPAEYVRKRVYSHEGRPPRAVWLGSPSTEQYLAGISPALLAEHRRSGLRLLVISRGHASLGDLDPMVDRVDWTLDGFAEAMIDAEVGIMPLPDEAWARGKCAYKLLQYGAAGLPLIGSPVGANRGALEATGGTAATTDDEWYDALAEVVAASPEERARRGAASFAGVDAGFSFNAWAPVWRRAITGAPDVV